MEELLRHPHLFLITLTSPTPFFRLGQRKLSLSPHPSPLTFHSSIALIFPESHAGKGDGGTRLLLNILVIGEQLSPLPWSNREERINGPGGIYVTAVSIAGDGLEESRRIEFNDCAQQSAICYFDFCQVGAIDSLGVSKTSADMGEVDARHGEKTLHKNDFPQMFQKLSKGRITFWVLPVNHGLLETRAEERHDFE